MKQFSSQWLHLCAIVLERRCESFVNWKEKGSALWIFCHWYWRGICRQCTVTSVNLLQYSTYPRVSGWVRLWVISPTYPLLPVLPWVPLDPLADPIDSCDDDLGMVVGVLGTILSLTLLL